MHTSPAQAAPAVRLPMNVKCFDRAPYKDTVEVQSGWHPDGRRLMVTIPNPMSKSCRYDLKLEEPGCQGCRWQREDDPRDVA
ncbi:hypothetical protein [Methylibium petroleiphilum]|uniref:Uncharacterized protein n=1 Tax=Methylibium petroleiphilum (strain ATCC BAA-1232 / LMG 22953 / PM1) TaxID=420662 RepID=A2SMT2_METPP|nr:hypothetical protein [Methylibium petroleiphilum]ABM96871.1 hypothetical protein Mpe_B0092 [Methylibium petroleiphilum PM1]